MEELWSRRQRAVAAAQATKRQASSARASTRTPPHRRFLALSLATQTSPCRDPPICDCQHHFSRTHHAAQSRGGFCCCCCCCARRGALLLCCWAVRRPSTAARHSGALAVGASWLISVCPRYRLGKSLETGVWGAVKRRRNAQDARAAANETRRRLVAACCRGNTRRQQRLESGPEPTPQEHTLPRPDSTHTQTGTGKGLTTGRGLLLEGALQRRSIEAAAAVLASDKKTRRPRRRMLRLASLRPRCVAAASRELAEAADTVCCSTHSLLGQREKATISERAARALSPRPR